MGNPEKPTTIGKDWFEAVLPNPFLVSEGTSGDSVPPPNRPLGFDDDSNQVFQHESPTSSPHGGTNDLLAAYPAPDFGAVLPKPIPILDYDDASTPLQADSPQSEFESKGDASPRADVPLRGVRLLGAVLNELSKHLGKDFSTAQLMQAAQQLIDISKAEYIGIPYKDVAERAGYYSWDLVRAFTSHQWQIAEVETNRMDHCDVDEFAPESYETAKLLLQGRNERTWEF